MKGTKAKEFRSRPTKVRGRVWIYASLTSDSIEDIYPLGYVIGSVEVVDCRAEPIPYYNQRGKLTVDKSCPMGYAWHLRNPVPLEIPVEPQRRANPVWFRPW